MRCDLFLGSGNVFGNIFFVTNFDPVDRTTRFGPLGVRLFGFDRLTCFGPLRVRLFGSLKNLLG